MLKNMTTFGDSLIPKFPNYLEIWKNMCWWIIYAWRSWLHCLLHTSGNHLINLHNYCIFISRSINNIYIGHLQHLPKHFYSNTKEMVYISLPHLYLERSKRKRPKHPSASWNIKNYAFKILNQCKQQKQLEYLVWMT